MDKMDKHEDVKYNIKNIQFGERELKSIDLLECI